jgi:hypothetical protein
MSCLLTSPSHHLIDKTNHKMAKVDRSSDMPLRQIDLSDPKYRSDGVPGIPKTVSSHDMTREDNTIFLECLSGAFNKNSRLVAELGKSSSYLPCALSSYH